MLILTKPNTYSNKLLRLTYSIRDYFFIFFNFFLILFEVFPHKKDTFPRPAVLLSDRAQIFLQAGLRVFNDESYQDFLARAYRIVTNQAVKNDFLKTNIHACLSHFMLVSQKFYIVCT